MDLLKQNGGKIAVVVVILAAAAFLTFRNTGGGMEDALANKLVYVDVTSGEIVSFNRGGTVVLPRTNPKTGERTLVPVGKHDDDAYYVSPRHSGVLRDLGEKNKWVDPQTLRVRESGG